MKTNRLKILVVDDALIIVERLFEMLNELDCVQAIGKASSYTEAEALLVSEKYDIALLDINLPGKNGIELLSFIKENYPSIKTIMLTNQSNEYYRNLCDKIGSDHFVDKSSEFEKIPHLVTNCVVV